MTSTRQAVSPAGTTDRQAGTWPFGLQHRLELDTAAANASAFDQSSNAALLERIQTLRTILPATATEVAIARREGARLRRENATLRGRLAAIDDRSTTAHESALMSRESR